MNGEHQAQMTTASRQAMPPGAFASFGRRLLTTRPRLRRHAAVAAASGALVALGLWTHGRVEESLRQLREDELRTILTADVAALETWIQNERTLARQWGQDPRLAAPSRSLVALSESGASAESLQEAPEQYVIENLARRWLREDPDHIAVMIDARDGRTLYCDNPNLIGRTMNAKALILRAGAWDGRTVFVKPFRGADLRDDVDGLADRNAFRLWTAVTTPVRDAEGNIAASMTLLQEAEGAFSQILQAARLGATGETFAFDDRGVMLSESRFTAELRELGTLPELTGELDWDKYALLNVQVRDPGGDLSTGFVPELEVGARPLTRLAAIAIAARDKEEVDARLGVITTPYRNYRGVDVIGAWRWLPEYGFGVASEIEASEAFAPLRYLEITFGVLLALLTGAVAATFASSFSVMRLRRKVRELRQLGPYALGKRIGEGGMGTVYLAEHALLKRPTAVKILSGEHLTEENARRFEREVQLASQLSHPNTIRIFDYGHTEEGVFYYAMEYLDGLNLAELVSENGPVRPARAIHILERMCASLREAHGRGFIHRDIKPPNVMLCQQGGIHDFVKVLDFGLVKPIDEGVTRGLTGKAQIRGTPTYMAPERLTAPASVDARSDVYAVGAVAYYLLSAEPLFPSDGIELLHHVVHSEPKPLSDVAPQRFPPELGELVMSCLVKDPDARPGSVRELRDRLSSTPGLAAWSQEDAARWWKNRRRPDA